MSTQLYQKRPIPLEAHQWHKNGDHPGDGVGEERPDYLTGGTYVGLEGKVVRYFRRPEPEYASEAVHATCGRTWHDHGWIDDLEGGHQVCPGDWIITGTRGEHWAVKDEIFRETYERVNLCDSQLENVLVKPHVVARCTLSMDHAGEWHESPQEGLPGHPLRWRNTDA